MINLYIDFDGVISDTIKETYKMLEKEKIDSNDFPATVEFYSKLDWGKVLDETPLINDSMENIKRIIATNRFDIAILTHVVTTKEAVAKVKFIRKYLPSITVIPVPKELSKTEIVNAKDSVLIDDYAGNLREWEKAGGIGVRFSINLESKGFKVINQLDQIIDLISPVNS